MSPRYLAGGMMHSFQFTLSTFRVALVLMLAVVCEVGAEEMSEYEIKAGFLCKFLDFVKWPDTAKPASGVVVIGLLGDDPFGGALDRALKSRQGAANQVTIRRSRRVEELRDCRIVFVSRSEKTRASEIVAALGGFNVLTVGDGGEFVRNGGIIAFNKANDSVSIEVNHAAADRAGLVISSRLLKLATIVKGRATPSA